MVRYNDVKRTSPEGALILREVYDNVLGMSTGDNDVESAFAQVLFREQEDISDYNSLLNAVNEFIALDMSKHLGLSIKEYLDSTPRETLAYIRACEEKITMLNRALESTQRETDKRTRELNQSLGSMGSSGPLELDY